MKTDFTPEQKGLILKAVSDLFNWNNNTYSVAKTLSDVTTGYIVANISTGETESSKSEIQLSGDRLYDVLFNTRLVNDFLFSIEEILHLDKHNPHE